MRDTVLIPWHVEDQPYTVEVEIGSDGGEVVAIYAESGERIPAADWDAHGFDDFQLGLCAARGLAEPAEADCRCGDRCRC
ncbi:MAG TPA: hypothetical protein VEA41_17480 [Salinarimonas sp.]|nr:hypothetical protein [Salinarimonas sp.]